jgi:UDP-N-acetylmuramoyl-tripeptide--D-alanyl-D-alanine ligase
MNRLPLSLVAHWAGGELHGDDTLVEAISHDTRQLAPGSLYVALRGERFDGHDFVADAAMRGATALLVERLLELDPPLPQVLVEDGERALARIAAGIQRDRRTRVVAITGSNGKTSVKTLVLAILQRAGQAYANPGNRNNEIGLPLAVIDAPEDADFAIYEMGAGKPGDIAYLTAVVRPDVALVNNIAAAHLERMGSLLGVAETKGAIYAALGDGGVAVVNADDAFGSWFEQQVIRAADSGRRVLRFGLEATAEVTARDVTMIGQGSRFVLVAPQGEADVVLALPGRHNVRNALAAAALALACDVPLAEIAAGLAEARPVPGRQVAHALPGGAVLIDDSYNANPGSMAAAIDALAASGDEAWLVLGDMRELGPEAEALHADAGTRAREAGIARLYALGPLSAAAARAFGESGRHFDTHEALAAALHADLRARAPVSAAGTAGHALRVLVKGSRGSAMDRIVTALLARGDATDVA